VLQVYGLTALFQGEGRFGLTSRFRRAAVSIAKNIAGRPAAYIRHLRES
jgi:four helix bundle protein